MERAVSSDRRRFLTTGAAVLGATAAAQLGLPHVARAIEPPLPDHVFRLGVASGDPLPDGIVLWTRLAPDPLHGGGMPDRPVTVEWEVAEDERFRRTWGAVPPGRCRRSGTASMPTCAGCARAAPTGTASAPAASCRPSGAPVRLPIRGAQEGVCVSRWPPARTGSRVTSPRTRTCAPRTRTSCCSSATTSTSPCPPPVPCAATRAATSRTHSSSTATATLSTAPIRIWPRCTPPRPGWSPSTTTRSTTTTRARFRRTPPSSPTPRSWPGSPPPTRRTTSTCRCVRARSRRDRTSRCTGGWSSGALPG